MINAFLSFNGKIHVLIISYNYLMVIDKIVWYLIIKRPARDACLCMGDLQAPAAPAAPHFVFLITL